MSNSTLLTNYESRLLRYLIIKSSEGSIKDVTRVITTWHANSIVSTTIIPTLFSNEKYLRWIIIKKNRNFIKNSKYATIWAGDGFWVNEFFVLYLVIFILLLNFWLISYYKINHHLREIYRENYISILLYSL